MKRRGRSIVYVAGAFAAIAAIALFVGLRIRRHAADAEQRRDRAAAQARGPAVTVVLARRAPRSRTLTLPAEVQAYQQILLYAKVAGYLRELRVDRGDRVKRGELLANVATPETDRQLAPLRANLATLKAIAERYRRLVPGVATQQDLDHALADVQAAQSEVDRLASVRSFDQIRAPFDGVITTRFVNVGALVPAATGATQSAQPVVELADTSRVRVIVYLGQSDAIQIHEGDAASIAGESDPLHPTTAVVTRISRTLDPRTRSMPVEIDVDNPHDELYPGVFVLVTLTVPAPPGVIVPSDAIVLADGKASVAVVDGTKVRFAAVQVGDDDGKTARVISGVHEGERVVAHVTDEVVDGGTVQPHEQQPSGGSGSGSAVRGSS